MVYIVPMPVYSITGVEVRQDRFAGKGQGDLEAFCYLPRCQPQVEFEGFL